jgi:hypothetical protein
LPALLFIFFMASQISYEAGAVLEFHWLNRCSCIWIRPGISTIDVSP